MLLVSNIISGFTTVWFGPMVCGVSCLLLLLQVVDLVFLYFFFFFFQEEDAIRVYRVTGVQTCALPIFVATRGTDASTAATRWLYSISAPSSSGGISRPWQSGQSGHASPEPVALTTLPMLISRKTEIGRASCRERV